MFLAADLRYNEAFFEDVCADGALSTANRGHHGDVQLAGMPSGEDTAETAPVAATAAAAAAVAPEAGGTFVSRTVMDGGGGAGAGAGTRAGSSVDVMEAVLRLSREMLPELLRLETAAAR